jgi:hypothetical protein
MAFYKQPKFSKARRGEANFQRFEQLVHYDNHTLDSYSEAQLKKLVEMASVHQHKCDLCDSVTSPVVAILEPLDVIGPHEIPTVTICLECIAHAHHEMEKEARDGT